MTRFATSAVLLAIAVAVAACPVPYWSVEGQSAALSPTSLTEEQPTVTLELEVIVSGASGSYIDWSEVEIDLAFDTLGATELSEVDVLIELAGEQLSLGSHELPPGEASGQIRGQADNFSIELDETGTWSGVFDITVVLLSGGPVVITPRGSAYIEGGDDESPNLQLQVLLAVVGEEVA